jgi:hypothetical protein
VNPFGRPVVQLELATAHARDADPEHAVQLGHEAVDPFPRSRPRRSAAGFADLARDVEAAGHTAAELREHAGPPLA